MSAPTGSAVVVIEADETPLTVVMVPVPRVTPPLENVTVPEGRPATPETAGIVKVNFTGVPTTEEVGVAVRVSPLADAGAIVTLVVDVIGPKVPLPG